MRDTIDLFTITKRDIEDPSSIKPGDTILLPQRQLRLEAQIGDIVALHTLHGKEFRGQIAEILGDKEDIKYGPLDIRVAVKSEITREQ